MSEKTCGNGIEAASLLTAQSDDLVSPDGWIDANRILDADRRLIEAISDLNELLENHEFPNCDCRKEHEQLLTWLMELQRLRKSHGRLAHVAKEMLGSIEEFVHALSSICIGRQSGKRRFGALLSKIHDARVRYGEQLEVLGVIVDE